MGERHSDDQSDRAKDASVERLQITEAAHRLGVSRDAVYKRVRRGSIPSETGEDGLLYVYIDTSTDAATEGSTDTSIPHLERLVQHQERELEYLRGQLSEEREARRRADHIIAALTERIPELEAPPQSAREAESVVESASEGESREGATEEHTGPQGTGERERVPWWRRMLGW